MSATPTVLTGYIPLDRVTDAESQRLASNESMVGSEVTLVPTEVAHEYEVMSYLGNSLGTVRVTTPVELVNLLEAGGKLRTFISLVYYDGNAKEFHGELFYVAYAGGEQGADAGARGVGAQERAVENFVATCKNYLEKGKRPRAGMKSGQIAQILAAGGEFTLERGDTEPLPAFQRGEVVFKKKRSLTDKMVVGLAQSSRGTKLVVNFIALVVMVLILYKIVTFALGR